MMLRQRETEDSFKAGALSLAVHALLLGALLISFNWKNTHAISIAQVELWDSVPKSSPVPMPQPVKLPEPEPQKVEPPKPEPVPETKPEPQVEIAVEKKPAPKEMIKKDTPKPKKPDEDKRKKLLEQMRQEDLKNVAKEPPKANQDAIRQLQQALLNEDKAAAQQKAASANAAASAGVVGEFTDRIRSKIRSHVNKTLCGEGNPELKFEIGLMPTGELSGAPKLLKSSGNAVCDEAVERAIRMSEPLPLPSDSTLFSQFRNLRLTFKPNE